MQVCSKRDVVAIRSAGWSGVSWDGEFDRRQDCLSKPIGPVF